MRALAALRTSRGRAITGGILLTSFLLGMGLAAWHVAAAPDQQVYALVAGDAPRLPALGHDDQTCRVCGAVTGILLRPSTALSSTLDDQRPRLAPGAGTHLPASSPFAGPLGSRAPPGSPRLFA
jgi:hypothetical protein